MRTTLGLGVSYEGQALDPSKVTLHYATGGAPSSPEWLTLVEALAEPVKAGETLSRRTLTERVAKIEAVEQNELRVGMTLYGFCRGHFGHDGYGAKRVEAIGPDWVIARRGDWHDDGPLFARCRPGELLEFTRPPSDNER